MCARGDELKITRSLQLHLFRPVHALVAAAAAAAAVLNVLGRRRPERRCKFAGNFIDVGLRRRQRRRCLLSAPDGGSNGRRDGGGRCVRGAHAV